MLENFAGSVPARVVAGILVVIGAFAYNNREIPELTEMCQKVDTFELLGLLYPDTLNLEAISALAEDLRIGAEYRAARISRRNAAAGDSVTRLGRAAGELHESALSGDSKRLSEALFYAGEAMGQVRYACRYDNN